MRSRALKKQGRRAAKGCKGFTWVLKTLEGLTGFPVSVQQSTEIKFQKAGGQSKPADFLKQ